MITALFLTQHVVVPVHLSSEVSYTVEPRSVIFQGDGENKR